ncbi:hypothetical protein IO405_001295 [Campylobacter lari]|nr:hypothetical protein [Campylobacter lari]
MQVSDLYFILGNRGFGYGESGDGDNGYYTNHDRELHITLVNNNYPITTALGVFGYKSKEDAIKGRYSTTFTYQSAYGGNVKYNMRCNADNVSDYDYNRFVDRGGQFGGNKIPKDLYGGILADFGGYEAGVGIPCYKLTKKYNGIYTFKTTYKGKTYTSILHLKLNE